MPCIPLNATCIRNSPCLLPLLLCLLKSTPCFQKLHYFAGKSTIWITYEWCALYSCRPGKWTHSSQHTRTIMHDTKCFWITVSLPYILPWRPLKVTHTHLRAIVYTLSPLPRELSVLEPQFEPNVQTRDAPCYIWARLAGATPRQTPALPFCGIIGNILQVLPCTIWYCWYFWHTFTYG